MSAAARRSPTRAAKARGPFPDRVPVLTGNRDAEGLRVGIVVSRFNEFVTDRLLAAAIETLRAAGVERRDLTVVGVPGAFELPLAAKTLLRTNRCDAVICLGAIIRGETPHFEYIATATATGILNVSLDAERPVIFGVLTTDTVEQALARAQDSGVNRGAEAAATAIEMASLIKRLYP